MLVTNVFSFFSYRFVAVNAIGLSIRHILSMFFIATFINQRLQTFFKIIYTENTFTKAFLCIYLIVYF